MAVTSAIEGALGHRFGDTSLLDEALTHSSFTAENPDSNSYERLEFLGDAVLEMVTTSLIYEAMPSEPEGAMTKIRASVVDESTLAGVARTWYLDRGLRLGVGEERSGGRDRGSILSDAAEAVIAAVYLDGGYERAVEVVERIWSSIIAERLGRGTIADGRSELQEILAKRGHQVSFSYDRHGPDHAAVYVATALVEGKSIGTGSGGSKKSAAIAAARDALERGV